LRKKWTIEEKKLLKKLYPAHFKEYVLPFFKNRTWESIRKKAWKLGVSAPIKGRKHSQKTIEKMIETRKKSRGENNPANRPEDRKKLSQNNAMHNPTKRTEVIKKISNARKKYFLNHPEAREVLSRSHKGVKNWRWKGGVGKRPDLGTSAWRKLRMKILFKYKDKCVSCGIIKNLLIHHMVPKRYFINPKDADREENLVVLCRKCHGIWEQTHIISGNTIIGRGVRVGHFVNIYNSRIGDDTKIGSFTEIANSVVGKCCNIQAHVTISNGCKIGDDVFIGPNTSLLNDKHMDGIIEPVVVEDHVKIGGGCTILPRVVLHKGCIVGAGSVVTKDVTLNTVVWGNPAK